MWLSLVILRLSVFTGLSKCSFSYSITSMHLLKPCLATKLPLWWFSLPIKILFYMSCDLDSKLLSNIPMLNCYSLALIVLWMLSEALDYNGSRVMGLWIWIRERFTETLTLLFQSLSPSLSSQSEWRQIACFPDSFFRCSLSGQWMITLEFCWSCIEDFDFIN